MLNFCIVGERVGMPWDILRPAGNLVTVGDGGASNFAILGDLGAFAKSSSEGNCVLSPSAGLLAPRDGMFDVKEGEAGIDCLFAAAYNESSGVERDFTSVCAFVLIEPGFEFWLIPLVLAFIVAEGPLGFVILRGRNVAGAPEDMLPWPEDVELSRKNLKVGESGASRIIVEALLRFADPLPITSCSA
jgi:hypothetical protein